MSKAVKEMMTQELTTLFESLDNCLVVGCQGMTVPESNELRGELHEQGLTLKVVKNSLACRALERAGLGKVSPIFDGPSALLMGGAPVETAKTFAAMRKKRPALVLRGAYVEGEVLLAEQAEQLARIPTREVLLAQILAGIQAPLSGMAGVLSGAARQLAMVLKATTEAKGPPPDQG